MGYSVGGMVGLRVGETVVGPAVGRGVGDCVGDGGDQRPTGRRWRNHLWRRAGPKN